MSSEPPPLRHNRDFMLLWSGAAVSALGSQASAIAYPLVVLALTGSPGNAGVAGFVALLPYLLLQAPAGMLVDRWDRKRVMVWCDVLRAVVVGTLVVALLAGSLSLTHVLVVGFVEGALTVCFRISGAAAVPNVVPEAQLPLAMSRNEARGRGASMLGQPLGGMLFGFGKAVPFAFEVFAYLVSLGTLFAIRSDLQAKRSTVRGRGEFTAGAVWLWRQPFLRTTTLLVAGSNLLFQGLFLAVIVLARDEGAEPPLIGLIFGVAAAGGVVGSLVAPAVRARTSMRAVVVGANWAWAALVPLVLLLNDPLAIGAVYAAMCFVGPVWNVVVSAHQAAVCPDALRGRVLGAAGTAAFGAVPLGSLLGGLALESFGARTTVAVLACWMVLLAVLATVSPSVRSAPRREPVAAAR